MTNRLRNEINRLLSNLMANIDLYVTTEKYKRSQNFDFLSLRNFKTFCCSLKIRGLGAKLCVAFLLF